MSTGTSGLLMNHFREREGGKTRTKRLLVSELVADGSYQRGLSDFHVEELRPYDEWRAGAMQIGERPNGSYAIIDGQHRIAAAERDGVSEVLCLVKEVEEVESEAREFGVTNMTQKRLVPVERWKAARRAKDPSVLEIDTILSRHGTRIGDNRVSGELLAVTKVLEIYTKYGAQHLDAVLDLMKQAFGELNSDTVNHQSLAAFDVFMRAHTEEQARSLVEKLAEPGRGMPWLVAHSGVYRASGLERARAFYLALVELYNTGKKSKRIEPATRGGNATWSAGAGAEEDA